MPKYKVTVSALFVDGVKHQRGDVIETDQDFGTKVEPVIEPEKPKRTRRTKAEIEVANEQDS